MEAGHCGLSGPTVQLNVTLVFNFENVSAIHLHHCMVAVNARVHTSRPETATPTPAQVLLLLQLPQLILRKYSNNINFRSVFKSACLLPQVRVHRGWRTWQQLNVRPRVAHVHVCVWTWLSPRCSAPPPAMMAATVPQASTCSTEAVYLCLTVRATTRERCMMLIQPCLMMPAITGTVSPHSEIYNEHALGTIYPKLDHYFH